MKKIIFCDQESIKKVQFNDLKKNKLNQSTAWYYTSDNLADYIKEC